MDRTQYDRTDHERAWELFYEEGLSYSEIAERMQGPSYETIKRWAKGEVQCDCEFHNWRQKRAQIVDQAREEVKEELELPDRAEREKKELRFIYRTEKRIQDLIEESNFEDIENLDDVDKLQTAVRLIKDLSDERRLILGEATEITEERGGQSLSLNKIAKQLNINDPQELVRAAEETIMEGENNAEN